MGGDTGDTDAGLPLHFRSASELGRLLRAGKITAQALLDQCLDQYARHNGALNAVIVTDIARARKAAAAADRRLRGRASRSAPSTVCR